METMMLIIMDRICTQYGIGYNIIINQQRRYGRRRERKYRNSLL